MAQKPSISFIDLNTMISKVDITHIGLYHGKRVTSMTDYIFYYKQTHIWTKYTKHYLLSTSQLSVQEYNFWKKETSWGESALPFLFVWDSFLITGYGAGVHLWIVSQMCSGGRNDNWDSLNVWNLERREPQRGSCKEKMPRNYCKGSMNTWLKDGLTICKWN